jgi:hypothetical protein
MTLPDKFACGNWIELMPFDPAPSLPGMVLVAQILRVDPPDFWIAIGGFRTARRKLQAFRFRLDENAEVAVNKESRWLYEVGRILTPDEYAESVIRSPAIQ